MDCNSGHESRAPSPRWIAAQRTLHPLAVERGQVFGQSSREEDIALQRRSSPTCNYLLRGYAPAHHIRLTFFAAQLHNGLTSPKRVLMSHRMPAVWTQGVVRHRRLRCLQGCVEYVHRTAFPICQNVCCHVRILPSWIENDSGENFFAFRREVILGVIVIFRNLLLCRIHRPTPGVFRNVHPFRVGVPRRVIVPFRI